MTIPSHNDHSKRSETAHHASDPSNSHTQPAPVHIQPPTHPPGAPQSTPIHNTHTLAQPAASQTAHPGADIDRPSRSAHIGRTDSAGSNGTIIPFSLPKTISAMISRIIHALILFDLPLLYYVRFKQVFDRAELYIQTLSLASRPYSAEDLKYQDELRDSMVDAWQICVSSMLADWKTVILVAPLLLVTIFTMLQIDSVAYLPIIRFPLLVAAICALISLMCSCISVMYFAALKSSEAVLEFTEDILLERSYLWNFWMCVSLPIIWLSWSMVSMLVAFAGFVWLTGTSKDDRNPVGVSARRALPPRIVISVIFAIGIASILSSVFTGQHLRHIMQEKKKRTIERFIIEYIKRQTPAGIGSPTAPVTVTPMHHADCAAEQYISRASAKAHGQYN